MPFGWWGPQFILDEREFAPEAQRRQAGRLVRMGQSKQQVDRLLRLRHRSRADQIDRAFAALDLVLEGLDVASPSPHRRGKEKMTA